MHRNIWNWTGVEERKFSYSEVWRGRRRSLEQVVVCAWQVASQFKESMQVWKTLQPTGERVLSSIFLRLFRHI